MCGAEKTAHSCLSGLLAYQHTKTTDYIEIFHFTNPSNNQVVNYVGLTVNIGRLNCLPVIRLAKNTSPCVILTNDHTLIPFLHQCVGYFSFVPAF